MTDHRSTGGFPPEAETAASDLIGYAAKMARERNISPFVLPEILLLAAIEAAARIDGTADGTVEWIRNVAARLARASDTDRFEAPINRAS